MALNGDYVFRPGELSDPVRADLGLPDNAWFIVLDPDHHRAYYIDRQGSLFEQTIVHDTPATLEAAVRDKPVQPARSLPYRIRAPKPSIDSDRLMSV
ncbi:hypothetical protein [Asticcacaulis sp. YBE204]|uniref:hypothetical protein n=1 Tax=Asticcacaulis sp. YBE204 TaxID=1282363 RepID=UPI0003C3D83E|nr:hypothetical protein [Asticcacaulis sp. YBE204]ESQ76884.1 hypothetical protein AEYBE204_18585 [Asticcacaulis sp. YBE204]